MITVRAEESRDVDGIELVIIDAFANSEFGHQGEAELVRQLRDNCNDRISLVAVDSERIVGHVLFTPVVLQTGETQHWGMGLAPVSIASDRQRSGIGTRLIDAGIAELASQGCPFVVVLGHPDYYRRFGFEPASQFGIEHGFDGAPQELLFIKTLDFELPARTAGMTVRYRAEFGPQHSDGS
ncbi:MAG: GNAT family N-acetyltransferase [Pirellulaceae bacterium]